MPMTKATVDELHEGSARVVKLLKAFMLKTGITEISVSSAELDAASGTGLAVYMPEHLVDGRISLVSKKELKDLQGNPA